MNRLVMASCFVLFCIANTRAEDIRSQVLDSYKQRAAYNQILALKKEMTGERDGVDLVAHVQYARRGSSDRFLYQNYSSTSSPAVWEARVRNERMAFTVGRKSIDSPWVLTHLFPDPKEADWGEEIGRTLRPDLFVFDRFSIAKIVGSENSTVSREGDIVIVELKDGSSDGELPLDCTLVLDPAKGLALQSCKLTFRSKQKGSLKVLDYIRENNLFFPKKIEETVESFTSINSLTYNDEIPKKIDFTLTAFGLPEPNQDKGFLGTPLFWLAVFSIAMFVSLALLRKFL